MNVASLLCCTRVFRPACLALFLLSVHSQAGLVGRWVAADVASGSVTTWTDRIAARPANASGAITKGTDGVTFHGNDYMVVPAANNPVAGDNTFTASVVCKVVTGATRSGLSATNVTQWWGNGFLVGRELPGNNRGDWGLAITSAQCAIAGRGNIDTGVVGSAALNNSLVHVVTGVFNGAGGTIALFVDGVKVGSVSGAGTTNIESDTMHFGVNIPGNTDTTYFTGSMQEVQIDGDALIDADVVTLQNNLLTNYRAGPRINSFTATPGTAYEGQSVNLAWDVNNANTTGTYSYIIQRAGTTIATGSTATGTFPTVIPDLAGLPQTVTYTFQAIETGGTNVTASAQASVTADPGIPTATSQSGLTTPANTAKAITLSGTDPNGGTLSYIIVTPPAHGTLSGTGPGVTYTPTNNVFGSDFFTFKVSDGKYQSTNTATVSLFVQSLPTAPSAVTLDDTTIDPSAVAGTFLANISTADPNVSEAHALTFVSGTGSEENARFTIVGHQLRAAVSFAAFVGQPQRIRIRSTDPGGLFVEGSFILTVIAKTKGVKINEVHYNGQDSTVRNSFIELYNDTAAPVSLTGWRLSGGADYLFPSGTTIAAGGYVIVAEDPATILSYWGKTALGPWDNSVETYADGSKETHGLSNDGDTIKLRNAADNVVSEVDYQSHSPWPAKANGNGTSMELINPRLDESHGSNWAAPLTSSVPTTTYIPAASTGWKYFKGTVAPPAGWQAAGFNDSSWLNGTTTDQGNGSYFGIGYGDNDDATVLSDMQFISGTQAGYQAIYLRHSFTIPAGQLPDAFALRMYVDDGAIVYINGQEIPVRFHCSTGTPGQTGNAISGFTIGDHEVAPSGWESYSFVNIPAYALVEGTNVVAVLAGNTAIGSTDFSFNMELKRTVLRDLASPGAQNYHYAANAAPAIRQVTHTPTTPTSADLIVVTAKITDPEGVASASLAYQLVAPGSFIPATLPKAISGNQFVSVTTPLAANPDFELAANWTTVAMNDDGLGSDVVPGDGIWTGVIPAQAHRTLVRYRITVADNLGASDRVPYADDPSLNFACFVYNGVPAYQGTTAADLTKLPTYHFLTRKADYDQCVAYTAADQLTGNTLSWTFENWEAAFVYNGVVYDHIPYRLHGANGRYSASGLAGAAATSKRAFKFYFNKGYEFEGQNNNGADYPEPWSTMITENLWENKGTYTFSLNEVVNFYLYNQLGVPAPLGNWAHFRTVKQAAEQPDQWRGDFWGLMYVHEDADKRFLKSHNLPKGNLYKLTRDGVTGVSQQRYQATFAPIDGSDHDEAYNGLRGSALVPAGAVPPAYVTGRTNLDLWARSHAFAEAIRNYDYWPTGDNNALMYFYPKYDASGNNNKGVLWWLPNDVDATWGPSWNNGQDLIHNALFNDSASAGGDTYTNPTLWPNYFNQVHEIRALLWQTDQINPLIDQFADVIRPFVNADFARWYGAPTDAGNFAGLIDRGMSSSVGQTSLNAYVAGMKDFAFDADNNDSAWPGGSGNGGVGGRAVWLDNLGNSLGESTVAYPAKPTISFTGTAGFPVNDLRFNTTAYVAPTSPVIAMGTGAFAAMQWRIAEVNTSGTYTTGVPRLLEIVPTFDSGSIATFANTYKYPPAACTPGHRYRARIRMKDNTGRWSYWSNALEFTAGNVDVSAYSASLVVSEIMYHATNPTNPEKAVAAALVPPQTWSGDDFDYIELRNISASTIDLTGFIFTDGFDFTFPNGTTMAPGASLLVVANLTAFNTRYGAGKPIAGAWSSSDKLSNGGELLTLKFGQVTTPIFSFTYGDDSAPGWPTSPDGHGPSLVRIAPEDLTRDPSNGFNWRPSISNTGNPGSDDRQTFANWMTAKGETQPKGDNDHDGFENLAEYAMGGNPAVDSSALMPLGAFQTYPAATPPGTYATLSFQRASIADDLTQHVQFSTNLAAWTETGVQVSATDNGDGTRTEVWRSAAPVTSTTRVFGRVSFTRP